MQRRLLLGVFVLLAIPVSAVAFEISFDATALTPTTFYIPYVTSHLPTGTVQTLELDSGTYTFVYRSQNGFAFTVDDAGLLDYDVSLDAYVRGRGTSTLIVDGVSFSIDATNLQPSTFNVREVLHNTPSATVTILTVVPGNHSFSYRTGNGFLFSVDINGLVGFDASLDAYVRGRGTSALIVDGVSFNIDATNLQPSTFNVREVLHNTPTTAVTTLTLVPGNHSFSYRTGNGFLFSVDVNGLVGYDASVDAYVRGRGTSTLIVEGVGFNIDATNLHSSTFTVREVVGNTPTDTIKTLTVVPGTHSFTYRPGTGFPFTVDASGTIDFESVHDAYVEGRGFGTLVVLGCEFSVSPNLGFSSRYLVRELSGWLTDTNSFQVIPGNHLLTVEADQGYPVSFVSDGTVNPPVIDSLFGRLSMSASCGGPTDTDVDGIPDEEDNCPLTPNEDQADGDSDGLGDACDPDDDNDGMPDDTDVCPGGDDFDDADQDTVPDFCDFCPDDPENDADGDGVCGDVDICLGGDDNVNSDGDSLPDLCDVCPFDIENDADGDGVCESDDNCSVEWNPQQFDTDEDGLGDVCDLDDDADGVPDTDDNCPLAMNPGQSDLDGDGAGDPCDTDDDGDGVRDSDDSCPGTSAGVVVTAGGCSVAQICPCEHPDGVDRWKNHGAYVRCVAQTSNAFRDLGLITGGEKDVIVAAAAVSGCGHKNK